MRRAINIQPQPTQTLFSVNISANAESDVEIVESPTEQAMPPGSSGEGFRVILYNDDHHSQDEVAAQLHKATEYPLSRCWAIMLETDRKGRAICYHGTREKCQHVTRVLREIHLQCEIDCD